MAGRLADVLRSAGRDVFVPLTFSVARRLEQVTPQEFAGDPSLATFALRSAQAIFVADGVVNWFGDALDDATTEIVVELARRLCGQTRDDEIVLGFIPGFGASADPAEAGKAALALGRAYGDAGVSALLVAEREPVADADAYTDAIAPLCNLGEYYQTPVVWLSRTAPDPALEQRLRRAGALVAGGENVLAVSLGGPETAAYASGNGRLVISDWDISETADPATLSAFGRAVREGSAT